MHMCTFNETSVVLHIQASIWVSESLEQKRHGREPCLLERPQCGIANNNIQRWRHLKHGVNGIVRIRDNVNVNKKCKNE